MAERLIFVYNADSGLFNTLTDIAHKLFSPGTYRCSLCAVTHSPFAMRRQWRRFLETLPARPLFLHRDEFGDAYPALRITPPVVLVARDNGETTVCLSAAEIARCRSVTALQTLISERCLNSGAPVYRPRQQDR